MRIPKFLLPLLLCLLVAPTVDAQDYAGLYSMTPKSGSSAGFEAALKQHAEWRAENGDPWSWNIYEVVVGQNLGDFYARSGGHVWADFDAYVMDEFSEKAEAHFGSTVGPLMESASYMITAVDTVNGRVADDMSVYNLFSITTYQMVPGGAARMREAIEKFHQAIVQADYPLYYAIESAALGGSGEISVVGFQESFAGFQAPEHTLQALMNETYGEEEAAEILELFNSSYSSFDNVVLLIRRELSVEGGM